MAASLTFAIPVTWDDSNTYERNMIVFVGKKAYTAIQNVPAGVAITNESYWIETGVPDIDITSLEQQITALSTRMTTAEGNISTNTSNITANANSITALSSRLNTAVTAIEADAARLNNIMITLYTPVTNS